MIDTTLREAYLAGLAKAGLLVNEQREEEGGEAACSLREVVALDNARYRIDEHSYAVRDETSEPDWDAPSKR